ncbi:hypothetical protein C4D60_Mb10t00920 [Musa balbisiana]|uniref:Uncharacterized protein n=1 Tax=Musa balbisiana TaxID=52838 RepID=A0A4V4H4G9_MUSBA|nr:hypothetical protein C4D60_Mb10t00920 [Musa balbisiana]
MKLTQRQPKLIFANVETALKPRLRSLQDMGFSDTEIVQLVSSCPSVLLLRDIPPRINFWRSLLGSNERKCPSIWSLSKKNICDKMTFLMTEAGCELTYIIGHPVILTFSLEKRLRPRYEVLNFLEQNKVLDNEHNLLSVIVLSEEKFRNKFLFLLSKEKFTSLYDSYRAAVQGN